jgi:curved DNA-binding protein CbpA
MIQPRLPSHYDTLRVDRGAPAEHVRGAYRRLAQAFHPDKHQGKPAAAAVMAQINQAYEVLSDPAQRNAYDDWLALEEARAAAAVPGAAVFTPDRFGWGGWLVFATTSLAVLTVGYVLIATWTSAASASRASAVRTTPVVISSTRSGTPPAAPAPVPRQSTDTSSAEHH